MFVIYCSDRRLIKRSEFEDFTAKHNLREGRDYLIHPAGQLRDTVTFMKEFCESFTIKMVKDLRELLVQVKPKNTRAENLIEELFEGENDGS